MADDFIVEEESSNRTFLYVAGGMGALVLLGIVAIVIVALSRGGGDNGNSEIAMINQTIEAQNALVTQTVVAMQTEAAYSPTPTPLPPTPLPSATPSVTPTPMPPTAIPTSVAQTAVPEATLDPGEGGEGAAVGTPAPVEPTPTVGPAGGGELPAGGLGMWGGVLGAFVLLVVIVLARRLRPAV